MMQGDITGQIFFSQITVQVAWADQSGGRDLDNTQPFNFVTIPRRGETVFFPEYGQCDVIEVVHYMNSDPHVVVVLRQRV